MINSQARRLIVVSMISALASSLSGIFVNTFLIRVNDDMIPIAAFNLSVYASAALSFPLFGACSKRFGAPGLQRLGILFQMSYLGGLLLFGRNIGHGIYLCGAMSGLSTAAGGIAGSCLTIAYTRSRDRSVFVSVSGTLTSVIAVISPLLSGFVIAGFEGLTGYYVTFGISLGLYVICLLLSFWFRLPPSAAAFDFRKAFFHPSRASSLFNTIWTIIGVREGLFGFLVSVMMFHIVKGEQLYGAATAVSKLIIVLTFFLCGKLIHYDGLLKSLRWSSWLMFLAPIPLFLFQNEYGLAAQLLLDAVASPIVAVGVNSQTYNLLEQLSRGNREEEAISVQSVWQNLGRAVGAGGFILLYSILSYPALLALALVINLCYVISYYLFRRIETTLNTALEEV